MNCVKCGAPIDAWVVELYETSDAIARYHADQATCPYVSCDSVDCRALKDPQTLEEWKAAAIHWQKHQYLSGCSHGC